MHFRKVLIVVALCFCSFSSHGNDSFASYSIGGLVLTSTDGIRMAKERLQISRQQITVDYEFENVTDSDITSLVAFPLPEFPPTEESGIDIDDINNIDQRIGFQVTQNESPIPFSTEKKKIGDSLKVTFFWTQTFPKKSITRIHHSYSPITGGQLVKATDSEFFQKHTKDYCFDSGFYGWLDKIKRQYPTANEGYNLVAVDLGYIVTTGNNWLGPIGKFELIVEKSSPKIILSTCQTGLKKVSDTRFEFTATNYVPTKELEFLFFEKIP